jgi:hypothetical protein
VCKCHEGIEHFDEKFVAHVHAMLSELYKARDEDHFCGMQTLLMVDLLRFMVVNYSEVDSDEQIESAKDSMRIFPLIEKILITKETDSHAVN